MGAELGNYKDFIKKSIENEGNIDKKLIENIKEKINLLENEVKILKRILLKFKNKYDNQDTINTSGTKFFIELNEIYDDSINDNLINEEKDLIIEEKNLIKQLNLGTKTTVEKINDLIQAKISYISSLSTLETVNEKFIIHNLDKGYYNEFTYPGTVYHKIHSIKNLKQFTEKFNKHFKPNEFVVSSYIQLGDKNFAIVDGVVYELFIENDRLDEIVKTDIKLDGMKIIYGDYKVIEEIKEENKDKEKQYLDINEFKKEKSDIGSIYEEKRKKQGNIDLSAFGIIIGMRNREFGDLNTFISDSSFSESEIKDLLSGYIQYVDNSIILEVYNNYAKIIKEIISENYIFDIKRTNEIKTILNKNGLM